MAQQNATDREQTEQSDRPTLPNGFEHPHPHATGAQGVVEYRDGFGDIFADVPCPICAGRKWLHFLYEGIFCAECNLRADVRAGNDRKVRVEFYDTYLSPDYGRETFPSPPETAAPVGGFYADFRQDPNGGGYALVEEGVRAELLGTADGEWSAAWDLAPEV